MRPLDVALSAVMIAATAVVTMVISIPFPPTRGYFNLGDAMVMLTGLLFGARIGGIAGGLGSALADILLGFGYFAPFTLFIKGTEGFLAGLIGHNRGFRAKIVAVAVAAAAMLLGYFGVETPLFGIGPAIAELVTINWVQVTAGAIISLALTQAVVKAYPNIPSFGAPARTTKMGLMVVVGAVIVLALIVGFYVAAGVQP
jgi:uncharacterized membrane protein